MTEKIWGIQGPPEHPREGWWMAGTIRGDPTHRCPPEGGETLGAGKTLIGGNHMGEEILICGNHLGDPDHSSNYAGRWGERFIWTRPDPRATA